MNTSIVLESSNDLLHFENDQTFNSIDQMSLTDSQMITLDAIPSFKKIKIFKQSSHCKFWIKCVIFYKFFLKKVSIITMKTAPIKSLITCDETICQQELNGNMFPAEFLEKYEILDIVGKVCFLFISFFFKFKFFRVIKLEFIKSEVD